MIELRKTPLFVRIGLMWWIVLLAWPWSRPFLAYANPFMGEGFPDYPYTPPTALPAVGLACLSLLHAVAAGWIVVKALEVFEPAAGFAKAVTRGLLVAWFAVSSWSFIVMAIVAVRIGGPVLEVIASIGGSGFASILVFPLFAFIMFWKATWILVPLGIATVLAVRQSLARAEASAGSARRAGGERTASFPPTDGARP